MDDDHDPADTSHWPEEFLISCEDEAEKQEFSLIQVKSGLKTSDLKPLANHLRSGLPLSPEISSMIADAIEGAPDAVCKIFSRRLSRGAPPSVAEEHHTEYLEIARIAEKALHGVKRTHHRRVLDGLSEKNRVPVETIDKARAYFRNWLKGLSG